jgi:L-iditol 2-dehydrogenase
MQAAFLLGIRQIQIRETPEPKLSGPRDVLVRVETVGVCGSDVHYYTAGRIGSQVVESPWILGHECAGTVVAVGSAVTHLRPGERVAIDPLASCGSCDQCRAGRAHTCRNQKFLGSPGQLPGALCEFLVMPAESCFPVPSAMTAVQAAAVEPLSIAVYARQLSGAPLGAKIAILGTGPIGLCVMLACRAAGEPAIYATDLVDERLAVARRCGAEWVGNPTRQDIVAEISKRQPLGLDFVFECAGEQETLDQGIELIKPGGTLLIVGIPEEDRVSFNIHLLRRKEVRIENVRRQNRCVAPAIELVARGAVSLDPLVTHHFSLEETQAAFEMVAARRDGVVKAIVHLTG